MAEDRAELTFDSKEWEDALKKISTKWSEIQKRKEFGGIIYSVVYEDIMDHFEKETGPNGSWASWSDSYEKHLVKIGRRGNKKLQFSGRLRQTITPTSWRPRTEGILFYNNAKTKGGYPYARGHDEGDEKLPQRNFMWLSRSGVSKLVEITLKWLSE